MEEPRSNRTEKPTPRKLQKSREQGQVPRSQELPPTLVIAGVLLFARAFGAEFLRSAEDLVQRSIAGISAFGEDPVGLTVVLRSSLLTGVALAGPVVFCIALASAVGQFAQGGFVFAGEGLEPNFAKLNPVQNLRGIFSLKRVVTTLRTVVKLVVLVWVVVATVRPEIPAIMALAGSGPREIFVFTVALIGRVLFKFLIFALVLALADFLYQKFEHVRGLKMSKQEIKDERREIEGDPFVRSRQRARQLALARRRMMAEVPRADVVVVNPTHCAVALRYDKSRGGAPQVVAKGVDRIAERIRAIAAEQRIAVFEDPPLAWALYRAVEVGQQIPADLYRAVAEVLAHVWRLRRPGARRRPEREATR